jgi:hypothetical protein
MDRCVEQDAEESDDDEIDQSNLSSGLTDNWFERSIIRSKKLRKIREIDFSERDGYWNGECVLKSRQII